MKLENGKRNRPTQGFHFGYMIALLELLKEKRTASYIYLHSTMKYKMTLLKMLTWLESKEFINCNRRYLKKSYLTPLSAIYKITSKGRTFLQSLS